MNTGSNAETAILLKKPDVQNRLIEIRDSNEYSTWEAVRNKFNEEFKTEISMTAVKKAYNKAMATSITISGPAHQHFDNMFDSMAKRLGSMIKITDVMIQEFNSSLEIIKESNELSDLEKSDIIMELMPKLDKLNTTTIKQLNFLSSQMEQVTIEQKKLVWDDNKLKEEMDKLQPIRLQLLEESGKIAIVDRSLLDN